MVGGELAGLPDSPWQKLMNESVSFLLENDVNFYIPLPAIQAVQLVPRRGRERLIRSILSRTGNQSVSFFPKRLETISGRFSALSRDGG